MSMSALNGAAGPWTNVWRKTADYRGPKTETVNLTALAGGQANVMLRFHYYNAVYEWWWQVDDVQLGQCKLQSAVNLPVLTPATAAQAGYPGTVVTYTLNLSNTDSVSHTFDVLIDHNTWPTNAATPIGPVAAQAAQAFTVTVAIPRNAAAGATDVAQVIVGTGRALGHGQPHHHRQRPAAPHARPGGRHSIRRSGRQRHLHAERLQHRR